MDADIAETVQKVLPGLAERAAAVDATGEIPAQALAELIEAGVFRLLQPKWCGGLEVDPTQFCELVRAVAAGCGSAGWLASVLGVGSWHVALFDERAQREVWTDEPNALICSSYAPVGSLVAVEGGYELTGHWRFSSGSAYSSWALLGATVVAKNAQPVDVVSVCAARAATMCTWSGLLCPTTGRCPTAPVYDAARVRSSTLARSTGCRSEPCTASV
jgi:3-hydroxy-9,10-secoandrosta-1,3,5(10)-triene-9,17-dione monooxygenase